MVQLALKSFRMMCHNSYNLAWIYKNKTYFKIPTQPIFYRINLDVRPAKSITAMWWLDTRTLVTEKLTWDVFASLELRDSSYPINGTFAWKLLNIEGDVTWTWDKSSNVIIRFDGQFLQTKGKLLQLYNGLTSELW